MQALSYLARQTLTVRGPERCFRVPSRLFADQEPFSVPSVDQKQLDVLRLPPPIKSGQKFFAPLRASSRPFAEKSG